MWKNSKSYKILTFSSISTKLKNQTIQILSISIKNYLAQNLNFAGLGAKCPFPEKFEIS